jgi:hypothetical protein
MELWAAPASGSLAGGSGAGAWRRAHCVLTRAGFLHAFASMDAAAPIDMLSLHRCQFEAGEAPVFNLFEAGAGAVPSWLGGRGRKVTFKAPTVEECCEWAIALREAIALAVDGGGDHGR